MPTKPNFLQTLMKNLRVRIVDIYVFVEVLGPFLGGVIFFLFVFLMFQALRLSDFFIIHGVSLAVLGQMVLLLSLSFLPTVLPIAFLIGVLVGFGRLSADSELVAMKANGMSLWRLSWPVMILGTIVVTLSLALNLEWVPWGERTFKNLLIKVSNTKVVTAVHEGTFTTGFFDLLIYADKVNKKTNTLERVFIYDEREPKNPVAVVAKSGEIFSVRQAGNLGSKAMLKLYDGNIHKNEIAKSAYEKVNFGQYRLFLNVEEGAGEAAVKPRMLEYPELMEKIRTTAADSNSKDHQELLIEYWRRIAVGITPFLFVFFGIGFGTVRTRAVRAGATLIAFGLIFIYWGLQAGVTVIAQKGLLPPIVAMEIPNMVVAALAIYGFRGASW